MDASKRHGTDIGVLLLLLILISTFSQSTWAVGFRLPEISTAGLSLSNAMVADSETTGALAYNPAAMGFHEDNTLVAGIMNVHAESNVKPEGGSSTDSESPENILVPNFYYMHRINDSFTAGLGINAPYGLETKWPEGTFPTFANIAGAIPAFAGIVALQPEHSALKMVNINPNIAFQIGDNTSIAVGLDYFLVKELIFNTNMIDINGDGNGIGWNIGLLHQQGDWGFGLAYRNQITADVDGTVDATAIGSTKSDAKADLDFPSLLQIGVRYRANDQLAIEFDIERTGWSAFDVVEIEHSSGPPPSSPITSTNEWEDTTAYRLGASYNLNEQTQLRFGYARENGPSNEDYFSARMPTNDLQTFSAGFAHNIGNITIEAGYMYVLFKEFDQDAAAGTYQNQLITSGGTNTEPNGTDAYNGKYNTDAHLVSVGISMTF